MGQKVNPTGFRIGVTEDWRSRWYADKNYATNLANDLEIREFLNKQLSRAAVSKVEIERAGDKIKVIVTTARPGVVIGKNPVLRPSRWCRDEPPRVVPRRPRASAYPPRQDRLRLLHR